MNTMSIETENGRHLKAWYDVQTDNVPPSEEEYREDCIRDLLEWGFFQDELDKMTHQELYRLHDREEHKHKYGPKD